MEQIDQVTMLIQITYTITAFLFTFMFILTFFIPKILKLFKMRLFLKNLIFKKIKNFRYIYILEKK